MTKVETKQRKKGSEEAESFELHGVHLVKNPPKGCEIQETTKKRETDGNSTDTN